MRTRSFAVSMAALFCGCSGAEMLVRSVDTFHAVCPNGVVFFGTAAAVPSNYREVALFPIKGVLGREQAKLASTVHRQYAGELGANGIILTSGISAATGNKVIGPAIGDPAQRRGMAVAILIPADSDRVNDVCRPAGEAAATATSRSAPPVLVAPEELLLAAQVASRPARVSRSLSTRRASVRIRPFDLSGRVTSAAESPGISDSTAFYRNQDVRSALTNLERLKIVTGAEEVRPGLVHLSIGELAPRAQMEYYLSYLHASYQAALPFGEDATVELWSRGIKLGEYTRDGLLVGADYATPR